MLVKIPFVVIILTHNVHGKYSKHISYIESRSYGNKTNHKNSSN